MQTLPSIILALLRELVSAYLGIFLVAIAVLILFWIITQITEPHI